VLVLEKEVEIVSSITLFYKVVIEMIYMAPVGVHFKSIRRFK